MKFKGSIEQLKAAIVALGLQYEELDTSNGKQFRFTNEAIINWYPSTGTIQYQGNQPAVQEIQPLLEERLNRNVGSKNEISPSAQVNLPVAPAKPNTRNERVFVVHGHDTVAREQLELILHKLGLDPFVLQNTGGGGLTIIEALEQEIGPGEDKIRFGIVLLTPDDFGYVKSEGAKNAQPRARQNVVLEMGMLLAALKRPNVAILKKGHLEVPTDAQGILYIPFNDHVKETVPKLVDRLTKSGFHIDAANITKASS